LTSIRRTLLVGLIATAVLAGALVAFGVYRIAYEQANELFDYQLRQMGIALRDRIFEGRGAAAIDAEDFLIPVWRADGAVVFVSGESRPPVRAPVGPEAWPRRTATGASAGSTRARSSAPSR
jgi:two-component system OmpR family sensor kinase